MVSAYAGYAKRAAKTLAAKNALLNIEPSKSDDTDIVATMPGGLNMDLTVA